MLEPLVFVTEPDSGRMARVTRVLEAAEPLQLEAFDSITTLRRSLRARSPSLIIGPWAVRGETLLAARSVVQRRRRVGVPPKLLILADHITPAKISLAHSAGGVDLVPCDPLDEKALLNRVILLLHGAQSLSASLPARDGAAGIVESLEHYPNLRKRFAA